MGGNGNRFKKLIKTYFDDSMYLFMSHKNANSVTIKLKMFLTTSTDNMSTDNTDNMDNMDWFLFGCELDIDDCFNEGDSLSCLRASNFWSYFEKHRISIKRKPQQCN